MTLLTGIFGAAPTQAPVSLTDKAIDVAMGDEALVGIVTISNAIDVASSRLDNLLNVSELLDNVEVSTPTERQMGRYMVAQALTDLELPSEVAVQATAGLESADKVGNEAFATIKQYVASIIEWLQKKWKELKKFVAKYWNKYFGDVERLLKGWQGLKEKVEKKREGYSLDGKDKVEFTKGSDFFFTDNKALSPAEQIEGLKAYKTVVEATTKLLIKEEIKEITSGDLIAEGGEALKEAEARALAEVATNKDFLKTSEIKLAVPKTAPAQFDNANTDSVVSAPMLGRKRIYGIVKNNEDIATMINSVSLQFADLADKQKVKEKVELVPATLTDIDAFITANIETMELVVDLRRSKVLDKCEAALEKANKALGDWTKHAPSETDSMETRATYRKALSIATAATNLQRRVFINFPRELCGQVRTVSSMQKVFCEKSLALHKKAEA